MGSVVRVLMVYRYFWPEAPHLGDMEKAVADALVREGHDVTVFTASSTHVEKRHANRQPRRAVVDDILVLRAMQPQETRSSLASRIANEVLFQGQLLWHIILNRRDIDKVVVSSIPPWAGPAVARFARRVFGIPYVFHVWDIHPEVDLYAGRIKKGWLYTFLRAFDRRNCRKAETVVTLSNDMIDEIRNRGVTSRIVRIPNFVAGIDDATSEPRRGSTHTGDFRVSFTGNMGRYQGLRTAIEAASLLSEEPIAFRFVGSGAEKGDLKRMKDELGLANVSIEDHVPLSTALGIARNADLVILPLKHRVSRAAQPSKLPFYLLSGTRILAIVDTDSELARLIEDEDVGIVAEPGNPQAIAAAIREEMAARRTTDEFSWKLLNDQFNRDDALRSWVSVITGALN